MHTRHAHTPCAHTPCAHTPCAHAMHTPCTHHAHAMRTPCARHACHAHAPGARHAHAMHTRHAHACTCHAHTCVPDAKGKHAALGMRPRDQAAPCHLGRRGEHGQGTEQPRARPGHLRRAARRAARRAGAPLLDRGRTRPHPPPLAPLCGRQQHRLAQRVELRSPPAAAAHEVVGPPPRHFRLDRLVGRAAPVAIQRGVAEEGRVLVPGQG